MKPSLRQRFKKYLGLSLALVFIHRIKVYLGIYKAILRMKQPRSRVVQGSD